MIYGFSVSAFNQQVKRNISRFDEDFMFDLNKIEMELLSKSQNVISIQSYGAKGGRTKPVKAFTEQGLYYPQNPAISFSSKRYTLATRYPSATA
ncbi:MAG: ORF6N domain-containing protein [Clostridiales bacterium]|nr:ORF6N domain-containing protein [Clostridiales bacterium]